MILISAIFWGVAAVNKADVDYTINGWLSLVRQELRDDMDYIVCIEGHEGTGKSALAYHLASRIDEGFNVDNYIYNGEVLKKWVFEAPKYSAAVIDEAGLMLFRRDSMRQDNKNLVKILQTCRYRNLCLFFVLPSIHTLESYLSNWRVNVCFEALRLNRKRGFAVGKAPYRQPWKNKTDWYSKFGFRFPDFPKGFKAAYLEHKADNTQGEVLGEDPLKAVYLRGKKNGLADKEIAELFGISPGGLSRKKKEQWNISGDGRKGEVLI